MTLVRGRELNDEESQGIASDRDSVAYGRRIGASGALIPCVCPQECRVIDHLESTPRGAEQFLWPFLCI